MCFLFFFSLSFLVIICCNYSRIAVVTAKLSCRSFVFSILEDKLTKKTNICRGKLFVGGKYWSRENIGRGKILVEGKYWSRENIGRRKFSSRQIICWCNLFVEAKWEQFCSLTYYLIAILHVI